MISVVMCTYNGEKYIIRQLESICNQNLKPNEIIICDDCSADNTVVLIKKYIEEFTDYTIQINLYENVKNVGVVKNFEQAITYCSGEIVFLSDQDDIWLPNKIESICKYMECKGNCNVVFTDALLIDSNGNEIGCSLWQSLGFSGKDNYSISDFTGKRFVTGATIAAKRNFLKDIMPFPECWIHDSWIAICAAIDGSIFSISEMYIQYRLHGNNVIGVNTETLIDKAKRRLMDIEQTKVDKQNMLQRFQVVMDRRALKSDQEIEILACISYWRIMCSLFEKNILYGLFDVFKELFKGNYAKYHTGFRGALNDIISVLLYRRRKN